MKALRLLSIACFCLAVSGCISGTMDHYSGKYRTLFETSSTRDMFRAKIGVPIRSWERGSASPPEYDISDYVAYDVFEVRGKIYKQRAGAGQMTVSAVTLGASEVIAIPITMGGILEESVKKHTLVVFYDKSLHYSHHELYNKDGLKENIRE